MRCLCSVLWVAALAGWTATSSEPSSASAQLALLYRRLLRQTAPQQLALQDALDINWLDGFLIGPTFQSPRKTIFDGLERSTFSYINAIINPSQKGERGLGWWVKNDVSEVILMHHYGAPVKIHIITEDGVLSEEIFGNPLVGGYRNAKPQVYVPRSAYSTLESLSQDDFTLHSFLDVPAWDIKDRQDLSPEDMKSRFPQHEKLFSSLAKPGFRQEHLCTSDDYTCGLSTSDDYKCGGGVRPARPLPGGGGGHGNSGRHMYGPVPDHRNHDY